MEQRFLDYTFDEERDAFGEPPAKPSSAEPVRVAAIAATAVVVLGVLSFLLQAVFGVAGFGTWWGILSSFGAMAFGTVWLSWIRYANAIPGIKNDGNTFRDVQTRGWTGWGLGILITGFYVLLYFQDDWERLPKILDRLARMLDPLALALTKEPSNRWFLYGFLYTVAVLVFGIRMLLRYRGNRYQQIRTGSVMFFQLGFAFLIPSLLKFFQQPDFYFTYFWPLKYDYLFPSTIDHFTTNHGALGVFMIFWGAIATFIATPLLTYFYGKRWYCSWVCGCGGLAETMGDPWRQLSDKSTVAWRIERWVIYAVLAFITATTVLLWVDWTTDNAVFGGYSASVSKAYGFWIGALFSGVIGVGFYPLLGSRVWCRFGCPMAAILGIFQRTWSRFRITTNGDQCMSCGNCSTYCEMGIDVRAYAEKGENIVRASCVGCGVCSAVCPRGVLKLESGGTHTDRFAGAESPIDVFLRSVRDGTSVPARESMFPDYDAASADSVSAK